MSRAAAFGAAIVALAGCICGPPAIEGELQGTGRIRPIRIPAERGGLLCGRSPDGRLVLFETTGPDPQLLEMDTRFRRVASVEWSGHICISKTRPLVLNAVTDYDYELVELLTLETREELNLETDEDCHKIGGSGPVLCSYGEAWLRVSYKGELVEIRDGPLRLGRSGKTATTDVRAGAVDAETGMLVLCGEGSTVEVYDLRQWKSVGVLRLGPPELERDVVADHGVAWCMTTEGVLQAIDLRRLEVREAVPVYDTHVDAELDLSASGRFLGVVAMERKRGPGPRRTVLKVFDVSGGAAREHASAEVLLNGILASITVLEPQQAVVVSSSLPVVWYYGE